MIVGITGGIGSGKSFVSNIIEQMGYPVYNADDNAKWLLNNNKNVIRKIQHLFGNYIYNNGILNREAVAKQVFTNKEKLVQLNAIVHPAVAEHFNLWINANTHSKLLFKEAAILFESGAYKHTHAVIGVWAPIQTRITRVCARDKTHKRLVINRINSQISEQEFLHRCNYIIRNHNALLLVPQINTIINKLKLHV